VKKIQKWLWRTLWAGKMTPGRVHYTAEEIKATHPEAEPVPGSMKEIEVPETESEWEAVYEAMRRPERNFRPEER
jgi:hypothetical protein